MSELIKKCCKCQKFVSKDLFYKNKRQPDGFDCYCKNCRKIKNKEWNVSNPEKRVELVKHWRIENPDKVREIAKRRSSKANFKIAASFRQALVKKRVKGIGSGFFRHLGYDLKDLRNHLEKQFLRGMSWDNYGKWHIDHITPISSFNVEYVGDSDFKICWALSNLRPIWARDNLRKSAKILYLL